MTAVLPLLNAVRNIGIRGLEWIWDSVVDDDEHELGKK